MTTDAKVGFLLGLVFIVVIAFLLNGLPGLLGRSASDVVTITADNGTRGALRLDAQAENAVQKVREEMINLPFPPRRGNMEEYRKRDRHFEASKNTETDNRIHKYFKSSEKNRQNAKVRIYTVKDGDNLAKIAKKIFGDDIGNKYATIQKIFEANKDIMNTPDHISVGQKLRIPALNPPPNTVARNTMESTGMFDKVKGTFNKMVNRPSEKKQAKLYLVKEGDSLWSIADKVLSDGTRFVDILKLNRNIIPDGESLSIGLRLKLPK
ncbi:MAG: LysM peptidoglycan-binding domain-containing protein [Planctomycetes bacterium]|nr:LysM peptidoglycan-binding domain-containing protein [Planctomycetota bacterium]